MLRKMLIPVVFLIALVAHSGLATRTVHAQEQDQTYSSSSGDVCVVGELKRIDPVAMVVVITLLAMMLRSWILSLKLGVTIHSARKNFLKAHLNKIAKSGRYFRR